MIFIIKMHWKWFLLLKCMENDFYYKNALEMIFTIIKAITSNAFLNWLFIKARQT